MTEYLTSIQWDLPGILLLISSAIVLLVLVTWHVGDSTFDMRHVLIDENTRRVSLHKLGQFIALSTSTTILWYETMHGRLTEWLFTGYMMAWAGASLIKRWLDSKPAPSGPAAEEKP